MPQLISTDFAQINKFSGTDELEIPYTHLKSVRDQSSPYVWFMWSLMPVFEGCRSQGKWCGSPAPKSPHNRGQKITFSRSEEAPHALQAGAQCGATGDEEGSNPTPAPHCEGSLDPPQTQQQQFETFPGRRRKFAQYWKLSGFFLYTKIV